LASLASHEVLGNDNASEFVPFKFEKWSIVNHRVDETTGANNESKNGNGEPNNLHKKDFIHVNNNLIENGNENEKHNVFHQNRCESKALLNICSQRVVHKFNLFLGIVDFVSTDQPFVFWSIEPFSFGFSFQVHLRDGEIWNSEEAEVFEYLLDGFVLNKIVKTEKDFLLVGTCMFTRLRTSGIDERIYQ